MMKILGTGLTGLVGSRITELLNDKYEFENIGRKTGIDITKKEDVLEKIKASDAEIVLHLAAKTDVDACEKDKDLGENGEAWKINVLGTKNVVEACKEGNKKIIYISTDFVFDGENQPQNGYKEEDSPNPINWYAKTKYEGEKIVQNSSGSWLLVRIAYPYRANFPKKDFLRAILERLKNGEKISAVSDHIFTPTFIDDIAFAINTLIDQKKEGVFHVVGNQSLSPFEASNLIASEFGLDNSLISKTTRAEFFKNRASRPFQLALNNDKIRQLGVSMHSFEEGVKEIRMQMSNF